MEGRKVTMTMTTENRESFKATNKVPIINLELNVHPKCTWENPSNK